MADSIRAGDRVFYETDNNGPIYRGKVIKISGTGFAVVAWDDGLETPISPDALRRDDDDIEPPTVGNEVV